MKQIFKFRKTIYLLIAGVLSLLFVNQVQADTSVTKNSITWTFDADYEVGQFANGDWYVVAPGGVQITSISPAWNGTGNGSMVNPVPGASQGYNVSAPGYDSALNINLNLPYEIMPTSVLISTTERTPGSNKSYVNDAEILTVVASTPPSGSFRPGYCDPDKIMYNTSSLNYSLLAKLTPTPSTPDLSEVVDMFARPWIDHLAGWTGRLIHPANNMPDYGREISRNVGTGALMLLLDYSDAEKEDLLINYVQLGIDLYSIVKNGGINNWLNDGGHASGRKWPIIFAGLMLNDTNMKNIGQKSGDYVLSGSFGVPPSDYVHFGEDDQTFYVTQDDIDITNSASWNPDDRGGTPVPYDSTMLGMPEWGIRHATNPEQSNSLWTATYRQCCTATSWSGFVLAAYVMGAKDLWNHDALFDYQDRWMAIANGESDPFGFSVSGETAGWRTNSIFAEEMWDTYRDNYGGNQNQIRADVDNNSTINTTDAMLTLRNSLGLSMSGTNWFSSTTTGDVNCDGNSNSTDAMLILRHSLGLDMSGTGWCE